MSDFTPVSAKSTGSSPALSDPGRRGVFSANTLRAMACVFMLLDHLWATLIPGNAWMNYVGRLAFPIFAFQISEGYFHTSDYKKYRNRLLLFAVISEVPFNLMHSGSPVYPFYQNVMFTLLLGLVAIHSLDSILRPGSARSAKSIMLALLKTLGCLFLGFIGFTDYGFWGVVTIIMFYLLRGFRGAKVCQLLAMVYINCFALEGLQIPVMLGSTTMELAVQGFAVLALPLIWMYNGRLSRSDQSVRRRKTLQYGFYAFYPLHMLAIGLTALLL